MKRPKALLLGGSGNTHDLLRSVMLSEGCEVEERPAGVQAAGLSIEGYCLAVFDIGRPNRQLLERLRAWHDDAPGAALLVVGGRTAQANRVAMLEAGVNAYLTKPVTVAELAARVRAALRRFRSQDARLRQLSFVTGTIDLDAHIFRAPEGQIRLTPTECEILEHLAQHMNRTVPGSQLVRSLWGADPKRGLHCLRPFIRRLRQKLEPDPTHPIYLINEPAIGYRLQGPLDLAGHTVSEVY